MYLERFEDKTKTSKKLEITLGISNQICYNSIMKIEQTTLSIQDIAEHREFLRDEPDEREIDDMLVRFALTFTESFESEVMG